MIWVYTTCPICLERHLAVAHIDKDDVTLTDHNNNGQRCKGSLTDCSLVEWRDHLLSQQEIKQHAKNRNT